MPDPTELEYSPLMDATCPKCGQRFTLGLFMLGYKTADEMLVELLGLYSPESLISHIQNLASLPNEHLTTEGK